MQRTIVAPAKKFVLPTTTLISAPLKRGELVTSTDGQDYYVDLMRSLRKIPSAVAKQLRVARRARKVARILVASIKWATIAAAGYAFGIYVLQPLVEKVITHIK